MSDPNQPDLTPDDHVRLVPLDDGRPDPPDSHTTSGATRRTVLRAAGLVALAGGGAAALSACATGDAATTTPSTAPTAAPRSAPSSATSSAPSAGGSRSAAAGPSVTTAEVPVGGGVIMPDAAYVVTQPEKGTFKAFSKICTHQGCTVAMITNRQIVCNCHQSHFSIDDGSVVSGPAPQPLPEAKTTVSGDTVTVSAA